MTSLKIEVDEIPDLTGKVALITGMLKPCAHLSILGELSHNVYA